jgi:hypothetical protein
VHQGKRKLINAFAVPTDKKEITRLYRNEVLTGSHLKDMEQWVDTADFDEVARYLAKKRGYISKK